MLVLISMTLLVFQILQEVMELIDAVQMQQLVLIYSHNVSITMQIDYLDKENSDDALGDNVHLNPFADAVSKPLRGHFGDENICGHFTPDKYHCLECGHLSHKEFLVPSLFFFTLPIH